MSAKDLKEFEITMVCYNLGNKYSMDEINNMFVEWAESKGIFVVGSIRPCEGEDEVDTTSKCNKQNVSNNEVAFCASREKCTHGNYCKHTDPNRCMDWEAK